MSSIDYKASGVNIELGDTASRRAYENAKKTFFSRDGRIGAPVKLEGGFAGALDFGDFYLIQNDDGTGTKTEIAERVKKFDTIGYDLTAMVADDAICVGAEVISLSNTFDVPKVEIDVLDAMTAGLAKACAGQKIVIPGGEIAEVPDAAKRIIWNATSVGIVRKEKFITGKTIAPNQKIIGLKDPMIRSNGCSLARKICERSFGNNWHAEPFKDGKTWGEVLLTPSKIFHRLILDHILGDFYGERKFEIHGLAHITGGGIPGNLPRIFPNKNLGASLKNLHEPSDAVKQLQKLGNVDEKECYRTWHCGTALMMIVNAKDAESICEILNSADNAVDARIVGEITDSGKIQLVSKFSGNLLSF